MKKLEWNGMVWRIEKSEKMEWNGMGRMVETNMGLISLSHPSTPKNSHAATSTRLLLWQEQPIGEPS